MADPTSIDIPLELTTERLVLRCPSERDGAAVYASVEESLAELRRFGGSLPWSLEEQSVDVSTRYCRDARAKFLEHQVLQFVVFTRTESIHVGNCGLHDIAALLSLAFDRLGMRRVEALPEAANERSCRLCDRVGLTLEGTLRNYRIAADGSLRDVRMYAAIR